MYKRLPFLLLALILLAQFVLLQGIFPVSELFKPEPIYNEDYGKTFYYTELGRTFFRDTGRFNGYTPDFYAGYLTHPTYHSCTLLQVAGVLLPGIRTELLVKSFVFILPLLIPLCCFLSARLFGLRAMESVLAAGLGAVPFWSFFSYYLYWVGSITYLWAIHLAPLMGGLLFAWFRNKKLFHAFWLCMLLPTYLLVHPYSILALGPFVLLTLLLLGQSLRAKNAFFVLLLLILVMVVNGGWLWHFLRPPGDPIIDILQEEALRIARIPPVLMLTILLNPCFVVFFLLTAIGCRRLYLRDRLLGQYWAGISLLSLCTNLLLIMHPFFIFLLPMRFFPLLVVQLCLPAGVGLLASMKTMQTFLARSGRSALWGCGVPILILLCYAAGWSLCTRMPVRLSTPLYPFILDMPEDFRAQGEWLRAHTDEKARVLFEDSPIIDTFFGVRRVLPIQALSRRAFIGGPVNDANSRALMIDFQAGMIGIRRIETISTEEIVAFVETYNIGWVACWSEVAQEYFDAKKEVFRRDASVEGMSFFTVVREPSYFLLGQGHLQATYNRIDLWEIEPVDGRIRLSFHYVPGMKLRGEGKLGGFALPEDPTPLIEILDPGDRLSVYYNR